LGVKIPRFKNKVNSTVIIKVKYFEKYYSINIKLYFEMAGLLHL